MGIHPSSMFALAPEALSETRQDIWHWAEPVIADCAADFYDRAMPSRLSSNLLAKKHCRLWHAIIHDQAPATQQTSQDLRRTSDKFGLTGDVTQQVNAMILEELFDIMLFRYRGSPRSTKASTAILMTASSRLSAAAHAAPSA